MQKKRHKLDDSIAEDYCLLGIVSDEPDYKLCWSINHALETAFLRMDDLSVFHKKLGNDQFFPLYQHEDESSMLTYRIIKNRSDDGFFLGDLRNIDYLVHIQGTMDRDEIASFIHRVAKLDTVRMCVPIELSKLKDRSRLMIW